MSKKIRKVVAKFDLGHQFAKKFGLPEPAGDLLYGSDRALSPQEAAAKAAKDAAAAAGSTTVAAAPTAVSDDTLAAREAQRRRQAQYSGLSANVLTGASGLGGGSGQLKSLLGS